MCIFQKITVAFAPFSDCLSPMKPEAEPTENAKHLQDIQYWKALVLAECRQSNTVCAMPGKLEAGMIVLDISETEISFRYEVIAAPLPSAKQVACKNKYHDHPKMIDRKNIRLFSDIMEEATYRKNKMAASKMTLTDKLDILERKVEHDKRKTRIQKISTEMLEQIGQALGEPKKSQLLAGLDLANEKELALRALHAASDPQMNSYPELREPLRSFLKLFLKSTLYESIQ